MLRPKISTCLLCSFRATRNAPTSTTPVWQTQRTAATLAEHKASKRPTRTRLAPASRVGSAGRTEELGGGKPGRRKQDGPFGGMNLKEAKIRGIPEKKPFLRDSTSPKLTRKDKEDAEPKRGFKALKMQRSLAPVSYNQRIAIKEQIKEIDNFSQFPLLKSVLDSISSQALDGLDDVRPTPVQRIAIPALLGSASGKGKRKSTVREDFLIAAETGSGKTLAYLVPTINALKLAEATDEEIEAHARALREEKLRQGNTELLSPPLSNMPHPTTGRPRAIILVPTSELVAQVGSLVKDFSHTVKLRSGMISSAYSPTVIRSRLFSPKGIDILVSTPHLLASIAESDPNILSRVTHLVVDEADSLLDRGFSPLTSAIIDKATPSLQRLVLCSATIPRSLDSFLRKRFPDIRRLVTPNLHAIPRRVQLGVVDVEKAPYQGNKDLACADTIWSIGKQAAEHDGPVKGETDVKRLLVFVNERETTHEVADFLTSKGIDATSLNRDTPAPRQAEILASFTTSEPLSAPKGDHPGSLADNVPNYVPLGNEPPAVRRSLPNVKVLVTTDLGSRGIDTLAVRHVILYDVPHSTIDFIHRLGRTGRMGRRGRGVVLVGKNDRRDVVAEVKEGMFKGQALI